MSIIKRISSSTVILVLSFSFFGCHLKPQNLQSKKSSLETKKVYVNNPNLKKAMVILIKKVEALEAKVSMQESAIETLKYNTAK